MREDENPLASSRAEQRGVDGSERFCDSLVLRFGRQCGISFQRSSLCLVAEIELASKMPPLIAVTH